MLAGILVLVAVGVLASVASGWLYDSMIGIRRPSPLAPGAAGTGWQVGSCIAPAVPTAAATPTPPASGADVPSRSLNQPNPPGRYRVVSCSAPDAFATITSRATVPAGSTPPANSICHDGSDGTFRTDNPTIVVCARNLRPSSSG